MTAATNTVVVAPAVGLKNVMYLTIVTMPVGTVYTVTALVVMVPCASSFERVANVLSGQRSP